MFLAIINQPKGHAALQIKLGTFNKAICKQYICCCKVFVELKILNYFLVGNSSISSSSRIATTTKSWIICYLS